jgi:hypothetical protein
MSYALNDRASAMDDLAATDGEIITVAGRSVSAHFQLGSDTQSANDFGADDRIESATVSFLWNGPALFYGDKVKARGKHWSIAEIDPTGGNVVTLTIEHDGPTNA